MEIVDYFSVQGLSPPIIKFIIRSRINVDMQKEEEHVEEKNYERNCRCHAFTWASIFWNICYCCTDRNNCDR